MKKFSLVLMLVLCGTFCIGQKGCDTEKADNVTQGMNTVADAITTADPIVAALQKASGIEIPEKRVAKIESIMSKVESIANKARVGTVALSGFVPAAKPYALPIEGILGAIAAIAASIKAFSVNRKKKKAEKAVDALITATIPIPKAGKVITDAARSEGVADYVEERYKAVVAN